MCSSSSTFKLLAFCILRFCLFQIEVDATYSLQLNLKTGQTIVGVDGLAQNGVNGYYMMRNGTLVTNLSTVDQMFDFGESCKKSVIFVS